jgi:hypothetical protein
MNKIIPTNTINYWEADTQISLLIPSSNTNFIIHIKLIIIQTNNLIIQLVLYSTLLFNLNELIQNKLHHKFVNMNNNSFSLSWCPQ